MTDFLSRVAARSVGATAAARPRLAGLFEPAGTSIDATLEVVDEEVVAPAPAPPREETPATREPGRAPGPPADARPAQVSPRVDPPDTSVERSREPTDVVAQSNYLPAVAAAIGPRAPEPEPVEADRHDESVPALVVAAAPLAQALPAAVARHAAPPPAAKAAADREEPQVRVHIGRLEVRANLQSPAPERPRREPPRPDGLSLADYLRGKREVRT